MSTAQFAIDEKIQDVLVSHPGTPIGELFPGQRLAFNATDLTSIKGGMVAYLASNGSGGTEIRLVSNGDGQRAVGIFYGDGSKPKELSVYTRGGFYAIKNWDTAAIASMLPGVALYSNDSGKLTVAGGAGGSDVSNYVVAEVTKQPATVDDYLGIKLLV